MLGKADANSINKVISGVMQQMVGQIEIVVITG